MSRKSITFKTSRKNAGFPKRRTSKVRLAIECTPEERRYIKTYASYADKTINEFVMECVKMKISECQHPHTPNQETATALDATEKGEGIIMFDSIDEFFKSMEA